MEVAHAAEHRSAGAHTARAGRTVPEGAPPVPAGRL